jgi:hypothetical protein
MRVAADYHSAFLPQAYLGNPLIEALPPILVPEDAESLLLLQPHLDMEMVRSLPRHLRPHEMTPLEGLFVPRPEVRSIEPTIARRILESQRPAAVGGTGDR